MENLQIAADDPICTPHIVKKIFEEMVANLQSTGDHEREKEIHLYEFAMVLAEGNVDQNELEHVKGMYQALDRILQ